jgi:hypothetical protein
MFRFIGLCFGTLVRLLRARRSLLLENLALRQQLAVLKRRHPRPRLDLLDKLFWVAIRRFWSAWEQSLIAVTPETVVRWHRGGFRLYWKLISKVRRPVGRRQTSKEVRELIFRMVVENPTWGAPRIHGELLMLSFEVSERTVSRRMKRAPRDPEPATRWPTLLMCDWEGYTTGTIGLPNPNQRRRENVRVPAPLNIYRYTARAFFRERFLALEDEGII